MDIRSPAFEHYGAIPREYTCDGADRSPPLAWSEVPAGAQSLVLIVDDPDAPDPLAPTRIWVHWILYNLPPTIQGLAEGIQTLPPGTLQGINDWGRPGYRGPCPPAGRHRYFFKLYALDSLLPDLSLPSKAILERTMAGHALAHAELVGTYGTPGVLRQP